MTFVLGFVPLLILIFAPVIGLGVFYRSWRLVVAIIVTTVTCGVVFAVLLFPLELAGPPSEGRGAGSLVLGPAFGWLVGHIIPVMILRGARRRPGGADSQRATRRRGEDLFDYSRYTLPELQDAAGHIDRIAYPERAHLLDAEIAMRRSSSH